MPVRYGVPPDHAAVIARIANFEPEDDGDLLRFIAAEAAAHQARAEAVEHLFEHLLNAKGLDPVAISGFHDCATADSESAATWTRTSGQFQGRYQGVREFAASGGVMPHQGRFMTGEDA